MNLKTIATICLCVLITACQTRGTYIEEADADAMRTSVETADQLMTKLGKPSVTIPKGEGKTMWVYEGIHSRPGITAFIPYLNYLVGQQVQRCTQLSVLVDETSGKLDEWRYVDTEDSDYWFNTNDNCRPKV